MGYVQLSKIIKARRVAGDIGNVVLGEIPRSHKLSKGPLWRPLQIRVRACVCG